MFFANRLGSLITFLLYKIIPAIYGHYIKIKSMKCLQYVSSMKMQKKMFAVMDFYAVNSTYLILAQL